jgi:hypothetical protein
MRKFNLGGGAGIELFRNAERYITISGNQRGACDGLPPIDDLIDAIEARLDEEKGPRRANGTSDGTGFDFNAAGQQTTGRDYDSVIRNGVPDGQRSEALQAVVWHLAGKGLSAEEITNELAHYPNGIGAKYADRLHEEVLRSYGKWRAQRRASAVGGNVDTSPWPEIFVVPGELPRVVDEAEAALLGLGRGNLPARRHDRAACAEAGEDVPRSGHGGLAHPGGADEPPRGSPHARRAVVQVQRAQKGVGPRRRAGTRGRDLSGTRR